MAKKPMRGERAAKSMAKSKKAFTPCSRCPNPKSCAAAGQCLAEAIGAK